MAPLSLGRPHQGTSKSPFNGVGPRLNLGNRIWSLQPLCPSSGKGVESAERKPRLCYSHRQLEGTIATDPPPPTGGTIAAPVLTTELWKQISKWNSASSLLELP